jgi:type I restriction enzyme R subunit
MTPEEQARQQIDRMLDAAGWKVQDLRELDLSVGAGVAVREFPLQSGEADYLLFVDPKAVGAVEAKPEGTTLSGVAEQSEKYLTGAPPNLPHVREPLPFGYESTGVETFFRDLRDPDPRSRRVFSFHRPETLREWTSQTPRAQNGDRVGAHGRAPHTHQANTCSGQAFNN